MDLIDSIRDKLERVNTDIGSEQGEVDLTRHGAVILGKNASKSLLNEVMTPCGMGEKRYLKFSPDTPRGNYNKVSIMESPSPRVKVSRQGNIWLEER